MIKLSRQQVIDRLVDNDIEDIRQALYEDDIEFLVRVLTGDGWIGYNQMTNQEIADEFREREIEEKPYIFNFDLRESK